MQDDNIENKMIVVLEDDPMVARIIGKATGLNTQNAATVEQFESTLKQQEPLAMFIDVHLGMNTNGIEIIPRLKNKMPFCPIIVVTGDHSPDLVGDALAAGADDFIYKPINPKELVAVTRNCFVFSDDKLFNI